MTYQQADLTYAQAHFREGSVVLNNLKYCIRSRRTFFGKKIWAAGELQRHITLHDRISITYSSPPVVKRQWEFLCSSGRWQHQPEAGLRGPCATFTKSPCKPFSGRCLFYFNSHGLQAVDQRIKSTAPRKKIVNHSSCCGAYSPRVLNNAQIFRIGLLWPFIENAQSTQSLFADLESWPKGQGYSQAMMPTLDRITWTCDYLFSTRYQPTSTSNQAMGSRY